MDKYIKYEDIQECRFFQDEEGEWVHRGDIIKIPAADVAPVRHGKWIWNPDGMDWGLGAWCCSECGSKAETWWANDILYNPFYCSGGHFCGNCGAKMDGDGE